MKLEAIAKAYIAAIELDEKARAIDSVSEEAAILRADLHALLMESLRENGIQFSDRSDAARIAYEITQHKQSIA